ncbi:MAG: hypothetical protein U0V74_00610 [Chitinophagales bacterium]
MSKRAECIKDEGNDWFKYRLAMVIRTVANPNVPSTRVAHFYSEGTTNTFMVKLEGKTVTAGVWP